MASISAPLGEIVNSIYGSLRLAVTDKNGLNYFNFSHLGFWHSFTAAIIIAPIFILLLNVRYALNENEINFLRLLIHCLLNKRVGQMTLTRLRHYRELPGWVDCHKQTSINALKIKKSPTKLSSNE